MKNVKSLTRKELKDVINKLILEKEDLYKKNHDFNNLMNEMREGFDQAYKGMNAIIARVIEEYGENGQISIKQPDCSADILISASKVDGRYVIKIDDSAEE